ncbi:MAG TPA: HypC/HybG/HupF family hydrogenase formation chaperone [Burkholderiaceae bacterium]|nr:HypC/HybG/HupF family hydrogenase formation chaperone [Burkholderiaceae bacterium]
MCIGFPMQVMSVEPGHALCAGRGETRRVRTALLGEVATGDWLLVFIDSAQERLDRPRADEINATLDLLQASLEGAPPGVDAPVAFDLPSGWTTEQLRALSSTESCP